jgi:hypothetical protein
MAKAKPLTSNEPERPADPLADLSPDVASTAPDTEVVTPKAPLEQADTTEVAPAVTQQQSSGGFLAPAAGGVLAAALGFGLSLVLFPDGLSGVDVSAPIAELTARVDALAAELNELSTRPVPVDARVEGLVADLASLQSTVAALSDGQEDPRIDALEQRLSAMESMPMGEGGLSPAALATIQADLAALKTQIQSQAGSGADLLAEVEAAAKAAEARLAQAEAEARALQAEAQVTAGIGRLRSALDMGTPFASVLAELTAAGMTVSPALSAAAETGLPTIQSLQVRFGDAARAGLEASLRADPGAGWADRLGTFLKSQTGARSLTPREGTDPDAVLSRAEDALRRADLPTVLTELSALPPAGQAAMADWVALAQSRLSAEQALGALVGGRQ